MGAFDETMTTAQLLALVPDSPGVVSPQVFRNFLRSVISVVADSTARAALFPSPTGNERVFNRTTSQIERYDSTYGMWVGALVTQTLVDNFVRADGVFAGSDSSSGHTWGVTGAGTFAILTNRLTVNTAGNAYAQMELDSTPLEIGGVASWITSGGGASSNATLVCGDSNLITGAPANWNAIHFTTDQTSWHMQVVQAGVFTDLATGSHATRIDAGSTTLWMRINPTTNTITYRTADGVTRTVTDSRIGTLVNKWVIYELGNPAGAPLVRWESVYAIEDFPVTSLVSKMLGATLRNRSTVKAFKVLLDRGIGFSDTLTNWYISAAGNIKTDAQLNVALGLTAGTTGDFAGNVKGGKTAPTYSTSITPNFAAGEWQAITVTDGVAFTVNAPTNPPSSSRTANLSIEVFNNSGGAMGVITWNAIFIFAGKTWANPASTKKRAATFRWSGTAWVCTDISAADY